MAIRWKFWKKDDADQKAQEAEDQKQDPKGQKKADAGKDASKKETSDNQGNEAPAPQLTHKEYDEQIDAVIASVHEALPSIVEEIQVKTGEIKAVRKWYSKMRNVTELVQSYTKSGKEPSRKDILYSNVLSKGARPDDGAGTSHEREFDNFVKENRPEPGFLKRMNKSSLEAKEKFLTKLKIMAQTAVLDAEQEREALLEDLSNERKKGVTKIEELYSFYTKMRSAIDNGDIDTMLDMLHGQFDNALRRVIKTDKADEETLKEVELLIKDIDIYGYLLDSASSPKTIEEGLSIVTKVTERSENLFDVMAFVEDVNAQVKSSELAQAYTHFLEARIGSYLPIGNNEFINPRFVVNAYYNEEANTLEIDMKGGYLGLNKRVINVKNSSYAKAFIRMLKNRKEFLDMQDGSSGFNMHFVHEIQEGHYNPASHVSPGRRKEELRGDVKEFETMAFPQTVETSKVLRAVIDENGVTEFDLDSNQDSETSVDIETMMSDFTKNGALEQISGLPYIALSDVQFFNYNDEQGEITWTTPRAIAGYESNNTYYDMSKSGFTKAKKELTAKPNFVPAPDGTIVNLDQVQCVEFGGMSVVDFAESGYNEEDVIEIFGFAEDVDFEDSDVLNKTVSALSIQTMHGQDGYTDWLDTKVSDAKGNAFLKAAAENEHFVSVDKRLCVNAAHICQAYVTMHSDLEIDENGEEVEGKPKPHLVMSFRERTNGYEEVVYPITEARMKTVIRDIVKASDGLGFDGGESYMSYAVNPAHLVEVVLHDETSEDYTDGAQPVDLRFTGTPKGFTEWTLPVDADGRTKLFNALADMPHMERLGNHFVSHAHIASFRVAPKSQETEWVYATGRSGAISRKEDINALGGDITAVKASFDRMSMADFEATQGRSLTQYTAKPANDEKPAAQKAPTKRKSSTTRKKATPKASPSA